MKIIIETMEIDPLLLHLRRILREGVRINALIGSSVRAFLCDQLGLTDEYVMERISTIFLDGKPVDNMDEATLHEGQVLALSAAMPGLVGATMRRGGFYAAFRSAITYHPDTVHDSTATGTIILKLFNMVAEEIGGLILGRGVMVHSEELKDLLPGPEDGLWTRCSSIMLDETALDSKALLQNLEDSDEEITLFVRDAVERGKMLKGEVGASL